MTKEQYLGCIYGLAIGDALGFPNEFNDRKTNLLIRGNELTDFEPTIFNRSKGKTKITGKKRKFIPAEDFPAGTYTDDTQMSLAIARALLKSNLKKYSIKEIMSNVKEELVLWVNDEQTNRTPGKSCIAGCRKMEQGVSWEESGDYNAKGCGAAMRSAPLGLIFPNNLEKLIETADAISKCTTKYPPAISAGIGTAYLTALALQKTNPSTFLKRILKKDFFDDTFKQKITQIQDLSSNKNPFEMIEQLGQGWRGEEAVAIALYCFLRSPEDYSKSVLTAANIDGDTDSVACITGAISGTYNGITKIPEKWIQNIENSKYLRKIGEKLFEKNG
ncbi:hypothetical protein GF358_04660 [Candidatus Woesearchaeota archaeon]|nr:hypothetical protein [Candidatus Woesearchaeota archaeon]